MKINKLNSFFVTESFTYSEEDRNKLISLIRNSPNESVLYDKTEIDISRTDWMISDSVERAWVHKFFDMFNNQIEEVYKKLGYGNVSVVNIWFQEYEKNSQHGWHMHPSVNFSNVFYLSLPEKSEPTEIVEPFTQKNIIRIDASEGDFLIFPAYALHRAPKNLDEKSRIIIAFNTNVDYPDISYGNNF